MLSKCSFALMRSVAIEFDRISVLFIVMLTAVSLFVITWVVASTLLSLSSSDFLSVDPLICCGDGDCDDPIDGFRTLFDIWFGDSERFCGEFIEGKLLIAVDGDDVATGTGRDETEIGTCDICIWFGGVWRCPSIWADIPAVTATEFGACCGDANRIFDDCIAAILCGEMRKFDGFPWCANPRPAIPMLDGFKLSGGVK